jgi:CheY-like chemotaxis protein
VSFSRGGGHTKNADESAQYFAMGGDVLRPIHAQGPQPIMSASNLVLQVDDDPSDALLLKQACRRAEVSFQLKTVSDGESAVAYLSGTGSFEDRANHPLPTLVLLDLKMPRMNGFDVLGWVRSHPVFKTMPVVVFTASNQEGDIRRAYEIGANSYLVKPVGIHTLVDMLMIIDKYWLGMNQNLNYLTPPVR